MTRRPYAAIVHLEGSTTTSPATTPSKTVRIIHISDTHNKPYPHVPAGDILVHTGDFTNGGSLEELTAFTSWFHALPHPHKIMIVGNHEIGRSDYHQNVALLQSNLPNVVYLQDSGCEVMGIRFWGSPWNNTSQNFGASTEYRAVMFEMVPQGTDVLLTHNPPWLVMDLAWHSRVVSPDPCTYCHKLHPQYSHWGCPALLRVIERRQIPIALFGHVHDETGIVIQGPTTYSNAAMDLDQSPIVLDVVVPATRSKCWGQPVEQRKGCWLSNIGSGTVLDIDSGNPAPGTDIILWKKLSHQPPNQIWSYGPHNRIVSGLAAAGGGGTLVMELHAIKAPDGVNYSTVRLQSGPLDSERSSHQVWDLTCCGRLVHVATNLMLVADRSGFVTFVPYNPTAPLTLEEQWEFVKPK